VGTRGGRDCLEDHKRLAAAGVTKHCGEEFTRKGRRASCHAELERTPKECVP